MRIASPVFAPIGLAAVTLAMVSACGGTSVGLESSDGTASAAANQPQGRAPGTSGKIAEVSGSTLQVQGRTSQTTVTVNDVTTIKQDQLATLTEVKVGQCVFAAGSYESDVFTATRVQISDAVDGSCQDGAGMGARRAGGSGGARPDGGAGPPDAPTDMPSAPSGAPTAGPMTMASGTVATRDGDWLSINGRVMVRGSRPDSGESAPTVVIKIKMTADGQVLRQVIATRAALVVGRCATAMGQADVKGAITATAITISAPVNGECLMIGRVGAGRPGGAFDSSTGGAPGA